MRSEREQKNEQHKGGAPSGAPPLVSYISVEGLFYRRRRRRFAVIATVFILDLLADFTYRLAILLPLEHVQCDINS